MCVCVCTGCLLPVGQTCHRYFGKLICVLCVWVCVWVCVCMCVYMCICVLVFKFLCMSDHLKYVLWVQSTYSNKYLFSEIFILLFFSKGCKRNVLSNECEPFHSDLLLEQYVNSVVRLFTVEYSYSLLGCVPPLQEVALHQSPPSFSVLCYPCPYRSLLPHNVISPLMFWSSNQSYALYLPLCATNGSIYYLSFGRCAQPISVWYWLRIGLCLPLWFFA